jgi:alpha-tubulin suppressor-like RCC1 family protein
LTAHLLPNLVRAPSGIGPLDRVAQVSAGHRYTCVRRTGQQVRCWGDNGLGQLGDGTGADQLLPVTVRRPDGAGPLTTVTQLSTGSLHACARLTNGQARCWGSGAEGQLGDGLGAASDLPVVVELPGGGALTGVTQVATGRYDHTCFRIASARVRCTGADLSGQIGNANVGDSTLTPVLVRNGADTGPLGGVTQVAAGSAHTCARVAGGQVRCWGGNGAGQIGDGTTTARPRPTRVQLA